MTTNPDLFAALARPFERVKTHSKGGRSISYITARMAMNRLDEVLGPENWRDSYRETDKGVVCTIEVRWPVNDRSEWVGKSDAGGYAGMEVKDRETGQMEEDEENDVKTGYSDAFKRAAVKWGVGRYLYGDGTPCFYEGEVADDQRTQAPQQRPQSPPQQQDARPAPRGNGGGEGQYGDRPPKTGKALFAWTKKQEESRGPGLLRWLNDWSKREGIGGRMVDWDAETVEAAHAAAVDHLGGGMSREGDY